MRRCTCSSDSAGRCRRHSRRRPWPAAAAARAAPAAPARRRGRWQASTSMTTLSNSPRLRMRSCTSRSNCSVAGRPMQLVRRRQHRALVVALQPGDADLADAEQRAAVGHQEQAHGVGVGIDLGRRAAPVAPTGSRCCAAWPARAFLALSQADCWNGWPGCSAHSVCSALRQCAWPAASPAVDLRRTSAPCTSSVSRSISARGPGTTLRRSSGGSAPSSTRSTFTTGLK